MANIYLHVRSMGKRFVIYEKTPVKQYISNICAEFVGTFILVFLSCMTDSILLPHLDVTLSYGLAVMVSVQCFAHLSGSHINPPVSVASFLLGYLSLANLPIYMATQLLGGIAGHGMMMVIVSEELKSKYRVVRSVGPCTPIKHASLDAWQVCLCEFVLTLILIVVCGAVWDWRNKARHDSVSIRFGLVIGVLAIAGGGISGANMNPAKSFGACLNNNDFLSYHWAYWAGPLLAGVVGGFFYRLIFAIPEPGVDDIGVLEETKT